ncbi:hypothetical protein [Streptomyces buecherae]|uniref:hypothetical protein n=1 Tax=Streptomyces buecherae TaxID=2763006 RepID=UPI0036460A95
MTARDTPTRPQRGHGDGDEDGDGHPGQPWQPTDEPHPDGSTPPGDGTHRK